MGEKEFGAYVVMWGGVEKEYLILSFQSGKCIDYIKKILIWQRLNLIQPPHSQAMPQSPDLPVN